VNPLGGIPGWLEGSGLQTGLRARLLETNAAPPDVLEALAGQPLPVLLDSSAVDTRFGRHTLLACRPVEVVTLRGARLVDSSGRLVADNPVEGLRRVLAAVRAQGPSFTGDRATKKKDGDCGDSTDCREAAKEKKKREAPVLRNLGNPVIPVSSFAWPPAPYGPGWIGFIGYEFGRHLEKLPCRAVGDTSLPDVHLAFYDAVAVYDAALGRWSLLWLETPDGRFPTPARQALVELLAGRGTGVCVAGVPPAEEHGLQASRATQKHGLQASRATRSNFTPEGYRRAVARCIEYIAAGDIFQVNLSQRFAVGTSAAPLEIYRHLRRRNPAWYSAMLLLGESAVLSSSPELFLRLRGGHVLTRPIKGTRPRTGQPDRDAAAAGELLASAKDNAELAMIIDLLRNDLGRVCRYGSVRVTNPRELEAHPTVFHLVGSVEGQLRPGLGAADLLAATFPGGSITGAPKIRAMEIIDELEGLARGVYTGAIGWFGATGDCELNIAIRTIVCDRGVAYAQAGGGIVADSTPDGEYQETLDKAKALLEAIALAADTAG
jgi:para-aminobenzoate synthetase component 1